MAVKQLAIGGSLVAAAAMAGGLYAGGVFTKSKDNTGVGLEISDNETTLNEVENNKDNQNQKIKKSGKEGSSMKDEIAKGTYRGKFGGRYAYFFLSTEEGENEDTWAKKAALMNERASSLKYGGFFKPLTSKPENERVKALKDKCVEIYKNNDEYKNPSFAGDWKEVWTYCSIFDEKPLTIYFTSKEDGEDRKYGSGSNKYGHKFMGDLVSTSSEKNNKFWELRQEEFKAGTLGEGTTSTYFNKDGTEDIKTLCQRAYEQTKITGNTDTETAPSEANIKKYCAID